VIARDEEKVLAGDILAKIPRQTFQSRDVTGGLPRVEEIFEARKPKPRELAIIAEVDGQVRISRPGEETPEITKLLEQAGVKRRRGRRYIFIVTRKGEKPKCYPVEVGKHMLVNDGDFVTHGTKLVDGSVDPHEYLEVMGEKRTQEYLLNEIQEVYRLQGVSINDRHIEVIIKQMLRKVTITDAGDTSLLVDDDVDRFIVADENAKAIQQGGRPARYKPRLLGITKASLSTESFISAASFQETARVLTQASISGKVDVLAGLKENVIMGHLIPAGTGRDEYRALEYETVGQPIPVPVAPVEEEEEDDELPAAI
jgi:DNA-directed RNA polymerase subunit beta'